MKPVSFRERMSGWISFDELSYNQAMVAGRRRGTRCTQQLTIEIDDIHRFIADPEHRGRAEGLVRCDGSAVSCAPSAAGSTCSSSTARRATGGCSTAFSCATATAGR